MLGYQWENPLFLWPFSIATLNLPESQRLFSVGKKNQGFPVAFPLNQSIDPSGAQAGGAKG